MAASGSKSTSKKSKVKRGTGSMLLILLAVAIPILIVGFIGWWLFGGGRTMGIQREMQTYLQEKYAKDFVVERPKITGSGIGVKGIYVAEAFPKDNKTLRFDVGRYQDISRFYDKYSGTVWANEEYPHVEQIMNNFTRGKISGLELKTHIITDAEPDPIVGRVPNIDEAIDKYRDRFFYSLSFLYDVDTLDEPTIEEIRAQFVKLADYINSKGAGLSYLSIPISVADQDAGYLCRVDGKQLDAVNSILDKCLDTPSKKGVYEQ